MSTTPSTDERSTTQPEPDGGLTSSVELHSVDWIPLAERHGKASHTGALWFVANVNLTSIATGVAVLAVGGPLFWTVVATLLGAVFGTVFMAFHASQGPHLGLPQLVQSRPQFGYLGAAVSVWIFALINYGAYNVSDGILSGAVGERVFGMPTWLGYIVFGGLATVTAIAGYRTIHRVSRVLAIPLVIVTAFVTTAAISQGGFTAALATPGAFDPASFATVFVVVTGFQLGWAPYVSDYSRYLPVDTSPRAVIAWTYGSSLLAGVWVFLLGIAAASFAPGVDPVIAVAMISDAFIAGSGNVVILALVIGLVSVMALNQYGGSLTLISIIDSFKPVKPTRFIRVATVLGLFVVIVVIAQIVGPDRFNTFYSNVLVFLAYLFTPWTAINLVDYFLIRRGRYVIADIFKPDGGIYGRWGWRGLLAYVVGLGAMVPFMVTGPFVGPVASLLGDVDIALLIGLVVPSVVYWLACRSLDLAAERRLADQEGKVGAEVFQ